MDDHQDLLEQLAELLDPDPPVMLTPWQQQRAARAAEARTAAPTPPTARAPLVDPVRFRAELAVIDLGRSAGIPAQECMALARRATLPTAAEIEQLAETLNPTRALEALAKRVYARPT